MTLVLRAYDYLSTQSTVYMHDGMLVSCLNSQAAELHLFSIFSCRFNPTNSNYFRMKRDV